MINLGEFKGQERPEGNGDFEPLPEGKYQVEIEKIEEGETAAGDKTLEFQFSVIGPKFANRKLFNGLNLWHSTSDQAREIAFRDLFDMSEAAGFKEIPEDALEMVGRNLTVKVVVNDHYNKEKAAEGKKINDIVAYEKSDGAAPAVGNNSTAGSEDAPKKPWEK